MYICTLQCLKERKENGSTGFPIKDARLKSIYFIILPSFSSLTRSGIFFSFDKRASFLGNPVVYWMIRMSRFRPFHERRPSMWSFWPKLKLKTCHCGNATWMNGPNERRKNEKDENRWHPTFIIIYLSWIKIAMKSKRPTYLPIWAKKCAKKNCGL